MDLEPWHFDFQCNFAAYPPTFLPLSLFLSLSARLLFSVSSRIGKSFKRVEARAFLPRVFLAVCAEKSMEIKVKSCQNFFSRV